nr:hypothetical protein [Tanacetum cinerariifolium]
MFSIERLMLLRPQHARATRSRRSTKGIIDSGCSRHMIGNTCYLTDYEDYDGRFVSFGDGKGRINGKVITDDLSRFSWVFFLATKDETSGILKSFITGIGNQLDCKAEAVNTACYVLNKASIIKPHNKTPYELIRGRPPLIDFMKPFGCPVTILNTRDYLGKFDEKANEGFFVGYSMVRFQTNDIAGTKVNIIVGPKESAEDARKKATKVDTSQVLDNGRQDTRSEFERLLQQERQTEHINNTNSFNTVSTAGPSFVNAASPLPINAAGTPATVEEEVDINNMDSSYTILDAYFTKFLKDHPKDQVIGSIETPVQIKNMTKMNKEHGLISSTQKLRRTNHKDFQNCLFAFYLSQMEPRKFKPLKIQVRNKMDERGIVIKNIARLVGQGHTQEEGIGYNEVFAPVARIKAIRLFLAYASFKDFVVYQINVKSTFLYGKIEEEVYVCQPYGFEDLNFPDKVYKVEKALYGLHQAPRAWYETLSTYLMDNGFHRGQIDKTLFIKIHKADILLVQVYVDDIIFGSTKKELSTEFEKLMHDKFQMSSMGELSFFLGLQVQQKSDGIFISQDKYVADILKKFDFSTIKTASTPMEPNKALVKDVEAEDVDVHLYRSMIGSLMYLTASRPDIIFAVCASARFQVTPKTSHLHAVKRIFRYLIGQPKLGLWYPRDSLFDLEAYSDSDYTGASLDRKSTTGGCQFLGKRLISWQCKKQTIVTNSTTEAEYVATASCCRQVVWIQNQMLDYGFNLMNTKIYIDNESTICIVKNLVFHSKTKHIEIMHHFIRDSYAKKLIQVIKIHTDHNIADLLTKAFNVSMFNFLNASIGLLVDETVYKEWEDIMERAATTASSLEAEQDSGNINRTQSMATLNEPFP